MTLRAQLRRSSLTGATLVVAAIFVAGCNSSSSTSSASAGASASGSASGSVSAASGSGSVAGSASGSASGGSSASGASSGASAPAAEGMGSDCGTPDLKISTGSNGGGAAGSFYSYIDFTNTGSVPCSLEGYPGVSLTDASGAQLGAAATRSTDTGSAKLVTLAPGATANAELRLTDDTVYPTSQCQPVTAAYLKVYPPNNTQAAQISFTGTTCANSSIKMLAIGVATPGTLPAS